MESLAPNMLSDDDVLEQWRLVEEQLHFDDMPPDKKQQPSANEKSRILQWVRSELFKTQRPDHLGSAKLHLPQFGNYVDHGTLFGKLSHVTPAPPRIWRLRPALYDGIMPRLGEKSPDWRMVSTFWTARILRTMRPLTFWTKLLLLPCSVMPRKSPLPSSGRIPKTRSSRNWSR